MSRIFLVIIISLFIISCHSRKVANTTPAKPSNETPIANNPKPTPPANDGAVLYKTNCGLCHELFEPAAFSAKKWQHEVPEMVFKANTEKGTKITKDQEEKILAYVLSMCEKK